MAEEVLVVGKGWSNSRMRSAKGADNVSNSFRVTCSGQYDNNDNIYVYIINMHINLTLTLTLSPSPSHPHPSDIYLGLGLGFRITVMVIPEGGFTHLVISFEQLASFFLLVTARNLVAVRPCTYVGHY